MRPIMPASASRSFRRVSSCCPVPPIPRASWRWSWSRACWRSGAGRSARCGLRLALEAPAALAEPAGDERAEQDREPDQPDEERRDLDAADDAGIADPETDPVGA